ncbi:fumarylacetoacetate hydrolase family protein [Dietzia sp. KRD202]|uniref:fumarylacetoacetate hydrolase family protein n=1 Tax=Dietzia sp. KRD202 TaxID=2729732 RepID=UPI0027DE938F|nr:fumarylacetoacetate hydrolase family protein [Dietzia sp. KRD202]
MPEDKEDIMRIANINNRLVLGTDSGYVDVEDASGGAFGSDPQAVYAQWGEFSEWASSFDPAGAPAVDAGEDAVWGSPAPQPGQVFAIGLNYSEHAKESGMDLPPSPTVFTKFPSSVTGHNRGVVHPGGSIDWEVELVVVIGKQADFVKEAEAWDHIAGVAIGQDLSERELQLSGGVPQFSLGKSYRGFAPIGPELVTLDALPSPLDLEIGCRLETGEVLQQSRTSNLIFDIPFLVAHLSSVCSLRPGDVIFTGTPPGVGAARTPKRFLEVGEVLVSWVEGIGELRTPIVR